MGIGDIAVNEAKQITLSLRRVRGQLEDDIQKISAASSALSNDDVLIRETLNEHAYDLKSALHETKKKINMVTLVSFWEKYSLRLSLIVFNLVVVYIVLKRIRFLHLIQILANIMLRREKLPDGPGASINTSEYSRLIDTCPSFPNFDYDDYLRTDTCYVRY